MYILLIIEKITVYSDQQTKTGQHPSCSQTRLSAFLKKIWYLLVAFLEKHSKICYGYRICNPIN